jgi:transposase
VKILREVLEDGKPVSQVAEEYGVHPNLILNWRKQLFEGAPKIFEVRRPDIVGKAGERKAQVLEGKLREKDEVFSPINITTQNYSTIIPGTTVLAHGCWRTHPEQRFDTASGVYTDIRTTLCDVLRIQGRDLFKPGDSQGMQTKHQFHVSVRRERCVEPRDKSTDFATMF